ncbi:hypothetical protein D3C87_1633880 [compost metagenome]
MVIRILPAGPLVVLFQRVLPFAIAIAAEPEVLEYQHAVFVAGLVKLRPFNDGPSPDADQVQVHVPMVAHLGIVAFIRKAEHGIRNDPVAPFDEDLLSVDQVFTTAGMFVPAGADLPYPKLYAFFVGQFPRSICKDKADGIQGMFTITAGPP